MADRVWRPDGDGPHPAVVIGQEATGPNEFIAGVAAMLADRGYVTTAPDYYRGAGPPDPEDAEDIATIMEHLGRLDFRQATYDVIAAVDALQALDFVDRDRVAVWGYCTGATMTLLAAALRRDLRAAVLFYPSQPRFDALGPTKPIHPIDMLWNVACPMQLLVGDRDPVWSQGLVDEVRARLAQWSIEHEVRIYPGADHAFCSPSPAYHRADAAAAATADALAFLDARMTR